METLSRSGICLLVLISSLASRATPSSTRDSSFITDQGDVLKIISDVESGLINQQTLQKLDEDLRGMLDGLHKLQNLQKRTGWQRFILKRQLLKKAVDEEDPEEEYQNNFFRQSRKMGQHRFVRPNHHLHNKHKSGFFDWIF